MYGGLKVYKIVILGDGGVGKTALTYQLCQKHFLETYDPTIEDSYRKQAEIDEKQCILEVLDTAGQEEYAMLRDQWIREGQGFVLAYSITSRESFERIEMFKKSVRLVKESAPSPNYAPIMIVANKHDKTDERVVSAQEGARLAGRLGCGFMEVSAKTGYKVEKTFYDIVRILRRDEEQEEKKPVPTQPRKKLQGKITRASRSKSLARRLSCNIL